MGARHLLLRPNESGLNLFIYLLKEINIKYQRQRSQDHVTEALHEER